jgi:hypothetical protein
MMGEPETLEAEFDLLTARAGLTIPAERRPAMLGIYAELRRMGQVLKDADLTPADEPSNTYAFDSILRSAKA